jgi:hypothetical protein
MQWLLVFVSNLIEIGLCVLDFFFNKKNIKIIFVLYHFSIKGALFVGI